MAKGCAPSAESWGASMRAVVQRCRAARVSVAGRQIAEIGHGLCAFVAVGRGDDHADAQYLADKLIGLRVFAGPGSDARMTASVGDVCGAILVVPQFTLYGDVRHGLRPAFTEAAPPEQGRELLDVLGAVLSTRGIIPAQGVFGADMRVEVINDGPVTILLDSRRLF